MGNRTNFNYFDGTAARNIDCGREEDFVVSYRNASRKEAPRNKFHMSAETKRNLRGAECAFSKAQYLLGTMVCFGGGLLMIMLERMF